MPRTSKCPNPKCGRVFPKTRTFYEKAQKTMTVQAIYCQYCQIFYLKAWPWEIYQKKITDIPKQWYPFKISGKGIPLIDPRVKETLA